MTVCKYNNLGVFLKNFLVKGIESGVSTNYSCIQVVPKNQTDDRVWFITFDGTLYYTKQEKIILQFDFTETDDFGYNATFEGPLQGMMVLNETILPAKKYISYDADIENRKWDLHITLPKCKKFYTDNGVNDLYFQIVIDDCLTGGCQCCANCCSNNGNNGGFCYNSGGCKGQSGCANNCGNCTSPSNSSDK